MHACQTVPGILLATLWVVLGGCGGPSAEKESGVQSAAAGDELSVYVVNYPLRYFAERIGGERVVVTFPAPAGVDPAYWAPDAAIVGAYQQADLVLLNGAGYAGWVEHASLRPSRLIDTSAGFRDRYVSIRNPVTHSHGPEGEHAHGEVAFTTWLDFELAAKQAQAISAAFERGAPAHQERFRRGLEALEAELRELHDALRDLAARGMPPLLGSHPVYQYLAEGYGLDIRSVHFEPNEFPGEAAWEDLDRLLGERRSTWMLWEAPPLARIVKALEQRGVKSLVFDPCGNVPAEGDFRDVQRANVKNLEAVVR